MLGTAIMQPQQSALQKETAVSSRVHRHDKKGCLVEGLGICSDYSLRLLHSLL